MKKWMGWLWTGILLAGLWGVTIWARSIPAADVCAAVPSDAPTGFTCAGKIEEANQVSVTADFPVAADSIYVRVGETVRKGDVLAQIDPQKTIDLLQSAYGALLSEQASVQIPDGLLQAMATGSDRLPRRITAPVSGTVVQIALQTDRLSDAGSALFVLSTGGDKEVRLHVPESEISAVVHCQNATLTGVGLLRTYHGQVDRIAPEATVCDGATGVDVWIAVSDADEAFRSGLHVDACIETAEPTAALTIPEVCVGIDDTGLEYVLVLENGKVQKRTVETGALSGSRCSIRSGLSTDDWVLMDRTLSVGQRIRPQAAEIAGETSE